MPLSCVRSAMAPLTIVAEVAQKAPWKKNVRKFVFFSLAPSRKKPVEPMNLSGLSLTPKANAMPKALQQAEAGVHEEDQEGGQQHPDGVHRLVVVLLHVLNCRLQSLMGLFTCKRHGGYP